jgi:hypothetical protein
MDAARASRLRKSKVGSGIYLAFCLLSYRCTVEVFLCKSIRAICHRLVQLSFPVGLHLFETDASTAFLATTRLILPGAGSALAEPLTTFNPTFDLGSAKAVDVEDGGPATYSLSAGTHDSS